MTAHSPIAWHGRFYLDKFEAEALAWSYARERPVKPYERIESDENLLLTAGATALFNRLANLGAVTAFDATNGRLCAGDSAAAVALGQTDLQASTNKLRKVFDAAPTISTNTYTAVATFGTSDANFAWNEVGVANASSGGVLLNRVVQSFGTKTSALTWVLTFVGTLS